MYLCVSIQASGNHININAVKNIIEINTSKQIQIVAQTHKQKTGRVSRSANSMG